MTTVLPHYPSTLFGETTMLWELIGVTVGGGQSASGLMPITRIDAGGLWKASLGEVGLWTSAHRQTWRALTAIADNGVQPLIVQVRETVDAPWPLVSGSEVTSFGEVSHSDDSLFSDDTGYDNGIIDIVNVGGAVLRATSMTIDVNAGGDLQGGEYFSIDHEDLRWRLYRIRTAIDNGDGTWDITFRPPLRADIEDDQQLEFDKPKCVMRLASPDAMDAVLEDGFFGKPSVSLIEAFPPFPEE